MLIQYLQKQSNYRFSGIININQSNGNFIGRILINSGKIQNANTRCYNGEKAILFLIFLCHEKPEQYCFFSEAGQNHQKSNDINISLEVISSKFKNFYVEIMQVRQLKTQFQTQYKFINNIPDKNTHINKFEFAVLSEIIEKNTPQNLHSNNLLNEIDLSLAIHSLIEKKLITPLQ